MSPPAAALDPIQPRVAPPTGNEVAADRSESAAVRYADWLIRAGRLRQARELIKQQLQVLPGSRSLTLLLGIAYLKDNNPFWAINTLSARVAAEPSD